MANLRDVRLRMRAIRQTLQVTKAMNLISTAKLRKGRRMLEDTEPYFTRIQKSMFDILSGAGTMESKFLRGPHPEKSSRTAILVITSDKGLAGGYNANIFRQVNDLCSKVEKPVLILIGTIGYRYFMHTPHTILENFSFHSQIPTVENAGEIAEYIISQYLWDVFSEVHVVYTHMYSAIKLLPSELQILPLDTEKIQAELSGMGNEKRVGLQFEYLPSEDALFEASSIAVMRALCSLT
jgi:F-type H+-transporting ATPase subunit gamma